MTLLKDQLKRCMESVPKVGKRVRWDPGGWGGGLTAKGHEETSGGDGKYSLS